MRDTVITLINNIFTLDDYGVPHRTESRKQVYAQVGSITRSEFYAAGRNGLNPDFVFTVFYGDYDGEPVCEYEGNRYAVYRTYFGGTGDYVELYVQREGGTLNTASTLSGGITNGAQEGNGGQPAGNGQTDHQ